MRVGLFSNPGSERNRRGMAAIEGVLEREPEIVHRRFVPDEGFAPPLRHMAEAGIELLVVNSGDGTVHGVLTELLANRPFGDRLPLIALLPRGTANMTAADCGLKGAGAPTFERLLAACRAGTVERHLTTRHILKVDYADGVPAPRGMFFGAAGIVDVIRHVTEKLHTRGIIGEWSHFFAVLGLLGGTLIHGFEALGLRPHEVGLAADGARRVDERLLLVLATSLDHLVLRSRPFWGTDGLPVRHTRISHPPRGLIRRALCILYGGENRRLPEESYRSGGAARLELWLDEPFTIDGEFFTPSLARPVAITADETIDFVRL